MARRGSAGTRTVAAGSADRRSPGYRAASHHWQTPGPTRGGVSDLVVEGADRAWPDGQQRITELN